MSSATTDRLKGLHAKRRKGLWLLTAPLLWLLLASCTPSNKDLHPLAGDPGFDVSALQPETRTWYNRFLNALNNPNQYPEINDRAATGDLYQLGRYVANDITTTLTIFRLTGDLRLLDHVDSVMQIARNQLKDYNGDGYPNWRWLFDRNETQYYNNDTHVMDELMTHGMIAQVAWTYHQNQDLPSPTGINYKERADFWTNYLQQWEAKWRKRNNKPTGFPFITKNTIHPYLNLIRYHWYTYRLTNNEAYLNEAIRLANDANTHEFRPITTPNGPGFVFSLGITKHDPQIDYLDPVHYAQYSALILLDLALEPFPTFTPETTLTQLANTIATKVIDNGSRDFAPSIGGTQPIGGLRMPDDTTRTPATRWAIYSLSAYSAYDTTNTIHTINQQVYERLENNPNNPTRTAIPAAMIIHDLLLHPGGEESN